ncbi:HNHc domain-containing protein [Penicillium ucsense]|uniref:HNHc domain-containing protein n=1 Tax=Penicillium ucsense TaxID=2839758 RepID=A0A8J8W9U7_9EURO|nr:HNHc domain-containing protein [Penicillium ucsense]KAF7738926.1 HNHc domain-containing protein [Penicillium ucsense]
MSSHSTLATGSLPDSIEELEEERKLANQEVTTELKALKARGSFNSQFWDQAHRVQKCKLRRSVIERKISRTKFPGDDENYNKSPEGKSKLQQVNAQQSLCKITKRRAQAKFPRNKARSAKQAESWLTLFTTSKMGLGITGTGAGQRDSSAQSNFRAQLIEKYGAQHETESKWLWCPILHSWESSSTIKASHIFPWLHSKANIRAIFGRRAGKDIFGPSNGLLMHESIEEYFDKGKLVIVPDVDDLSGKLGIMRWLFSKPRNFKMQVLDRSEAFLIRQVHPNHPLKYCDLDNRVLSFRTDFRPAARYLYYHYCVSILKKSWSHNNNGKASQSVEILAQETDKPIWATPGRYIARNMLQALAEEVGHSENALLAGADSCLPVRDMDKMALVELTAAHVQRRPALDSDLFHDPAQVEGQGDTMEELSSESTLGSEDSDGDSETE